LGGFFGKDIIKKNKMDALRAMNGRLAFCGCLLCTDLPTVRLSVCEYFLRRYFFFLPCLAPPFAAQHITTEVYI
jgi:hypothetical protein